MSYIYDLQIEVSNFRVHGYIQSFCECGCVQHEGGKTCVADFGMFGYPLKVRIQSGFPSAEKMDPVTQKNAIFAKC